MRKDRPNPATFPIKLPYMCIKLQGLKDGLEVMEPFLGIGLTAIAYIRLGVLFIGFETDNEYIYETLNRLNSQWLSFKQTMNFNEQYVKGLGDSLFLIL